MSDSPNIENLHNIRRGRHKNTFPLIVLALGFTALIMLGSSEWIRNLFASGVQQVLSINQIQTRIAISHLWVEEFVTGDTVDLDEISGNLIAAAIALDGIEKTILENRLLPDLGEDLSGTEILARAKSNLARFTAISKVRISGVSDTTIDVGIGSKIDSQFDAVFAETLTDLRSLEKIYQAALDQNEARSKLLERAIIVAWLLMVSIAVGGLWHRERRRVEAETALLEAESRLQQSQKMDAVGRLAGGIAHDINNHLAAMTMQCEVIKLKAPPNDPIIERMDAITAISSKSADLIKRLLAFSRQQPVQPEVFNPEQVVQSLEEMLESLIGEGINLQVQCNPDCWNLLMDPTQLEQILLNLIINARDALPDGGKIDVLAENRHLQLDENPNLPAGDYVVITVRDNGVGIPAADLEKIYEPFFTTKDITERSGLGLSTVHGIVTQNRGHVEVYSTEGSGTRFEIFLPRTTDVADVTTTSETEETPRAHDSRTILLVEDNPELRHATTEILQQLGYRIVTADSGERALEIFDDSSTEFDLVITDVVMPGIGGKALSEKLTLRAPNLPILFVSGHNDDVILHHGVETGQVDFLAKPYSAIDLAKMVARALRRTDQKAEKM